MNPAVARALRPLAVRIGSIPWLPRLLPRIVALDLRLQGLSRGRLTLLDLAGLPNLLLTVRGRRSGVPRSTPLLAVPDAGRFLVAGSNFGGPDEPLWVLNLEAAGAGTLRYRGRTESFVSRRLEHAERAAAWQRMLAVWPNFATYAERTDRLIKVYELRPVGRPV